MSQNPIEPDLLFEAYGTGDNKTLAPLIQFSALDTIINASVRKIKQQAEVIKKQEQDIERLNTLREQDVQEKKEAEKIFAGRLSALEDAQKKFMAEVEGLVAEKIKVAMKENSEGLNKLLADTQSDVQTLKSKIESIEAEQTETKANFASCDEKILSLQTGLGTRDAKLEGFSSNLDTATEKIGIIQAELALKGKDLEEMQMQLGSINSTSKQEAILSTKLNSLSKKIELLQESRESLVETIQKKKDEMVTVMKQVEDADISACSWDMIEQFMSDIMKVSSSLRASFIPEFTQCSVQRSSLQKSVEKFEAELLQYYQDVTSDGTTDPSFDALQESFKEVSLKFSEEEIKHNAVFGLSEQIGKMLEETWVSWAYYAHEYTKSTTLKEAAKNPGKAGTAPPPAAATQASKKKKSERERYGGKLAAGRVASKKALEATQKEISDTRKKLMTAIKEARASSDNMRPIIDDMQTKISEIFEKIVTNSNGIDSSRNDIIDLKNSVLHLEHDLDQTKASIPDPTPPYDDSDVVQNLRDHGEKLLDLIEGVTYLKESEGKFDSEIKLVFEEHANKIAHLIATKADAKSIELALKGKAPASLETHINDFVHRMMDNVKTRSKNAAKKSRADRATLEARLLKLVSTSLYRLQKQQRQLSSIVGPFNSSFGSMLYKCLACDRPSHSQMIPKRHVNTNHKFLGSEKREQRSRNMRASHAHIGTREAFEDIDDLGERARRNVHTYSPYRTLGAGFRLANNGNEGFGGDGGRPSTAPHTLGSTI
jgi:chromosome segregation ATPase